MLGESEALPTVSSDLADHSADPASLVKKALQMSLAEADATRDSAPAGLDTALRDLDSNPSANLVAVSFLKSGLKVWYAYFRAISRNSGLESLAAHLPPPTIARIAADISATVPHQSVADRIERTFTVSRRGKSRTGGSLRRRCVQVVLPRLTLQKHCATSSGRSNQTFHQTIPPFQPNLSAPSTYRAVGAQRRRPPHQMYITSNSAPPNVSAPITNNTAGK